MPENLMIPKTFSEFAKTAQNYITKSKEAGKNPVAIANSLDMMFKLFVLSSEQNNKLLDTEWQDRDGDGIPETLVNNQDGAVISSFETSSSGADSVVGDIINEGQTNIDDIFIEDQPIGQLNDVSGAYAYDVQETKPDWQQKLEEIDRSGSKIKKIYKDDETGLIKSETVRDLTPSELKVPDIDYTNIYGQNFTPDPNRLNIGNIGLIPRINP